MTANKKFITASWVSSRATRRDATRQKYHNYYFETEKNNNDGQQKIYHGIVGVVSCDATRQKYYYFDTEKK